MDLQQLSFLNGEKSFEIIKALIARKSKKICPVLDSRMEKVNEASRKLKRLQRLDKFIFEERGSNDLHVGWPIIRGKFSDGTLVRCPLLYFPVTIVQEQAHWELTLREDAGITFNKSFLLAYSFYNKVKLNEELPDTTFEDFDRDSTVFRTQLYQLLKETVELNFNPDTFTDDLIPFQEFKKAEFEELHHSGEIKLFPEAVLGLFPQAGSQLVPDYLQMMGSKVFTDLEDFFSSRVNQVQQTEKWVSTVREEKIYTPFSLDAYQEHALRSIKDGRSIVVQGPPGTGKSQLIANLMADAIASGKKVLLVCQKRVALDVVYDRLKKVDVADFLGLIHDFRNDRKSIYEKIARQIDRIDDFKARNRSIDIIQLERRFFHVCRTIDQLTETLEEFRMALFLEEECGMSVKELYLTSNPKSAGINIRQEYQYFNFSALTDFTSKIRRYARYATVLDQENNPWRNRKSFAYFKLSDLRELEKTVRAIPALQRELMNELNKILPISIDLEGCDSLLQRLPEIEEMLRRVNEDAAYRFFQAMIRERNDETSVLWLQNMERVVMNCFNGAGIESTLPANQIIQTQVALHKRMVSRRGLIKRIQWEMSEHKFFLKRVLIGNNLKFNKEGLRTLEKRIDHRLNLEHHLTTLREKNWLIELPENANPYTLKKWFESQHDALHAKHIFNGLRELLETMNVQKFSRQEFHQTIRSVMEIVNKVPAHRTQWRNYLTPYQIQQLVVKPELEQEFVQMLQQDFDKLCEFDKLKESMLGYENDVLIKLRDQTGNWEENTIEALFQNSIRLAWIEHIEMKYPILRSVSTFKMNEMQNELQQMVHEKQKLTTEILLLRARERVYENIEYNRLNNRVTYRDLHHQVTKKKKIWPVRKVITEFSEELFNLMPCWMASPESVSAIFPMQQLFDLVIFDEASQCFSERGIPAMYRGNQILIAGDNKQLKPFELYQVRWEEETEEPDLEVDSLLELSERYLPTVQLQGHYRSQSLSLIDFSNQFFYGGDLKLLPNKTVMNDERPSIEFHKITGQWENQTNPLEAQAVIQCAFKLMNDHPKKEIGIITFNAPQQTLIMDLMEEACVKQGVRMPESLFVKNIENVQGDERDIIIFSIGYAPDKDGKLNMQFGSLNVAGGENRLNVAITRAREKIIILSSILPEELKLQGIKNEGPKLLKKYLDYSRSVSEGNFKLQPISNGKHSSDWYLSTHVINWSKQNSTLSFSSHTLPFTDLMIEDGKKRLAAILTDDQSYCSSLTVKEAHIYTPDLLQQKNWNYYRLFSRTWWMDREAAENELAKFVYYITE
jgi:Cdc6-like AAA superfamily ATPase